MYIYSMVILSADKKDWNKNLNIHNAHGILDVDTMLQSTKKNITDIAESMGNQNGIVRIDFSMVKVESLNQNTKGKEPISINTQKMDLAEINTTLFGKIYAEMSES